MIEKLNLKILSIDYDGNAKAEILNNKRKLLYIPFRKENIVFSCGDFVSGVIKKKIKKLKSILLKF